ncbi:hypothetical protein [Pseudactinotalea sp. HY160]|uniref:hypothetical protein n=1 Tax=Pseudactinotalea sp. HY160 TaxID=2654490 RepID=UPI0018832D13|nr:hypothetical protein [Pseudactinotalea sp. HY160]
MRASGRRRIYTARLDGLDSLRRELDNFWRQALDNLKRVAEDEYHRNGERS